jgi:tellurite methyltransferase
MFDGGYDEGYTVCECFWGEQPSEMVKEAVEILNRVNGREYRALDLGCGEGKNSAAMTRAGFQVVAIDKSEAAIGNAKNAFPTEKVDWRMGDLLAISEPWDSFDLVIATGSLHCLKHLKDISQAITSMQKLTKIGGINVVSSFNDGPHDMGGHLSSFCPTLLPHDCYMQFYEGWEVIRSSNVTQIDEHPHNGVEHFHSITRILARRIK